MSTIAGYSVKNLVVEKSTKTGQNSDFLEYLGKHYTDFVRNMYFFSTFGDIRASRSLWWPLVARSRVARRKFSKIFLSND